MVFERNGKNVIAIDDQEDILELSKIFLEKAVDDIEVDTTTDPREVIEEVEEHNYDAVLSDFDMPEMNGVELLEEVREIDSDLPFVLYTGKGSEEIAADAVNHGVTDYFQKEAGTDHYQMIANSLVDSIGSYRDAKEKDVFQAIVDNSENPIVVTDMDSEILYVNEALLEVTGYDREEIIGGNPRVLNSEVHDTELFEKMYSALENGQTFEIEDMTNVTKTGDEYMHDQTVIPVLSDSNGIDFYASISNVKA